MQLYLWMLTFLCQWAKGVSVLCLGLPITVCLLQMGGSVKFQLLPFAKLQNLPISPFIISVTKHCVNICSLRKCLPYGTVISKFSQSVNGLEKKDLWCMTAACVIVWMHHCFKWPMPYMSATAQGDLSCAFGGWTAALVGKAPWEEDIAGRLLPYVGDVMVSGWSWLHVLYLYLFVLGLHACSKK